MDIIQNIIYYFSAIPLEYLIATSVGIGLFLYACYYATTQYRYIMNRRFSRAKYKQLGGVPLTDADRKLLSKRNKYHGAHRPLGPFARRANTVKRTIKTRWHNILTSVQTNYNPWFLQDKIKRLQSEKDSLSNDKWAHYRTIGILQTQLDKYVLGIEDEMESEHVVAVTESEKNQTGSNLERFGGGFGTQSEFA